jgi:hypothetical protein
VREGEKRKRGEEAIPASRLTSSSLAWLWSPLKDAEEMVDEDEIDCERG